MGRVQRVGIVIGAWAVTSMPAVASACAVCTAGKDEENAFAFLMTTIFMSAMPLIAIGTLVFVLWRRIRRLEAEQASAEEARGSTHAARAAHATPHLPASPPPV